MDSKSAQAGHLDINLSRYKSEIITVLIIAVCAFVIKAKVEDFNSQSLLIKNQQQKFTRLTQDLDQWQKINQKYKELEQNGFFNNTLEFKRLLEDKAQQSNIKINDIRPTLETQQDYKIAKVSMACSSDYKNIIAYLRVLEKNSIIVEKFKISNMDNTPDKKIEIVCKAFVRGD